MIKLILISLSTFILSIPIVSEGQTLFKKPDTVANYSAYRYADECNAAVTRVTAEIDSKNKFWRDTLAFASTLILQDFPPEAKDVGKLCYSKINIDTIPVKHAGKWANYLNAAGMEKETENLLIRLMDSSRDRQAALALRDIILPIYMNGRPPRFDMCKKFYNLALNNIHKDSAFALMLLDFGMIKAAIKFGDFDLIVSLSKNGLKEYEKTPVKFRDDVHEVQMVYNGGLGGALGVGNIYAELDSLSVSTVAYRKLRDKMWNTYVPLLGNSPYADSIEVPSLKGNWAFKNNFKVIGENIELSDSYSKMQDGASRPVPGKINVITFIQGGCHQFSTALKYGRSNGHPSRNCWPQLASLRRLKAKFPDVEVTVVSKTYGLYADGAPLKPELEADTLASYILGFHKIPALHLIAEGTFMRIPGIDNRRIDTGVDYQFDYEIDGRSLSSAGNTLIVDESGKVFHSGPVVGADELIVAKKIEVVLKRMERLRTSKL